MQCACPIFLYVVRPALQYFCTLSHKRHDFRGKKLLNLKCVFWVTLKVLSQTFFILRRTKRDIIKNVHWFSYKVPIILVKYLMKFEFVSTTFEIQSNFKYNENPSNYEILRTRPKKRSIFYNGSNVIQVMATHTIIAKFN
jgi:hypothetical protein